MPKKRKPRKPPRAEVRWQLGQRFHYEVQMAYELAGLLLLTGNQTVPEARWAGLEAFTIHVRQLIEFFWREKTGRRRDAYAVHYFAPGEWAELRPPCPPELEAALRNRIGRDVTHLTYERTWTTAEDRAWRPAELCTALAPTVLCFVDNVDHSELDLHWLDACRERVEGFQRVAAHVPPQGWGTGSGPSAPQLGFRGEPPQPPGETG
jgi:hypothetical protein